MFLSNGQVIPSNVGTLGDSTPIFADASYYSTSSLQMVGSFAAYGALYRQQLWVGILVRKLARATARIPLQVRLGDPDGKNQLEKGPLQGLLDKPTPEMTGFALKEWVAATRKVYGEAFLLKMRDDKGVVRELQPMHPRNTVVRRNADTGELEYVYSAGTRNASWLPVIPAADVIPFTSYNPDNMARGLSALEGLRSTLQNEDAARRANASFWTRGARPSLLLSHPDTLSEAAQERLKRKAEASHGGPDNMGGIAVFEEGITAQILNLSAEEMQYIESRKLNREEVCAAFDVPPPVVHILDRATFSNITEQLRSMYRDTMAPDFEEYQSVLNAHLVPDFYPDGDAFSLFNMGDVLRGDFEKRMQAALQGRQAGLLSGNEGRRFIDLPPSDNPLMDEIFANAALAELGAKPAVGAAQPDDSSADDPFKTDEPAPGQEADQGRSFFRALMGRLSRVKGKKPELRSKLIDEHRKELSAYFDSQRTEAKKALLTKSSTLVNLDSPEWNAKLSSILLALSKATTTSIGGATADDLDGSYDPARLADWLQKNADESAANINSTTSDQLAKAYLDSLEDEDGDPEDAIDGLFDGEVSARADQISTSRVSMLGGLASQVAADQSGAHTKTWVVTSANARPSHAAMDGETVSLGDTFSNGMNGPGDPSGGADEVAGCTCDLQFSKDEE
ncbi:MAG: phage portal protein [Sphingomicrobium sp.]